MLPRSATGDFPMINAKKNQTIVATMVPDNKCLNFLPHYLGQELMIRGENLIYDWMTKLSEDYIGGLWDFYNISNGGFYMAPSMTESLRVKVDDNGFIGRMSADAAGIVATLFALNKLACGVYGTSSDRSASACSPSDHCDRLVDFAYEHKEAKLIFRAID